MLGSQADHRVGALLEVPVPGFEVDYRNASRLIRFLPAIEQKYFTAHWLQWEIPEVVLKRLFRYFSSNKTDGRFETGFNSNPVCIRIFVLLMNSRIAPRSCC